MSSSLRVGCDVCEVQEISDSVAHWGDRYLQRVFTAKELSDCAGDCRRLAARFAAKEAVIKTFNEPNRAFALTDIEVVSNGGAPTIQLHGELRTSASENWSELKLSLSHADCHAMAVVVAI
jgi:holo-[acyl-carrier protein] synthase